MIYIILIAYLAFTFWGSLVGALKEKPTPEGYFLANRNLKSVALFFTIVATNFSAFYFLGYAGEGYRIGYIYFVMMGIGTGLAAIPMIVLGTRAWKMGKEKGFITPAELIYDKTKSPLLRYLYAAVMILYTLPYLALQIIGGGYLLENLTNGDISYGLAILVLTIFTIVYVIIGGMKSVAKTDFKQGILMFTFMLLAVILISDSVGGLANANTQLFETKPALFSTAGEGEFYTPRKWFSFMVFWIFCIPMFPQLFMRFYIAKDVATLKKSALMYGGFTFFVAILPVIIGVLGHITFPDLIGKEADQILPMMLMKHTSEFFAALIMTGAIAAFMSSLDSQLLAISTMTTRDFYLPLTKKELSFKNEVNLGRVLVGVFAVIGLIIAINPFDTIFDMGKMAFGGYAILFPVTFAVIRLGGLKPIYGILSIVVGVIMLTGFYYQWIPGDWAYGFESFMVVLVVCTILVGIGVWQHRRK